MLSTKTHGISVPIHLMAKKPGVKRNYFRQDTSEEEPCTYTEILNQGLALRSYQTIVKKQNADKGIHSQLYCCLTGEGWK